MRRSLLVALILLLTVVLAWILRGTRQDVMDEVSVQEGAKITVADSAGASAIERNDLRTDEGRTEPATTPLPGGGWILSGQALNERGEPVAGVKIRLVSGLSHGWGGREALFFLSSRADYGAALTNESGSFVIRLDEPPEPSRRAWSQASPGILCDRHAGRPTLKSLPIAFLEQGGECDLVLRGGFSVSGRVLTPEGTPAAFASIYGNGMIWSCDESGGFRAPIPAQPEQGVFIHHESGVLHIPGLQVSAAADLELGDLHLRGPGRLAGRVILPDGSPAPQLQLSFRARSTFETPDDSARSYEGRQEAATMTDATGAFQVSGLTLEDFAASCIVMNTSIPLQPSGEATDAIHWLTAGAESDGHVLVLPWRMLLVDVPELNAGMNPLNYEVLATAAAGREPPAVAEFRRLAAGYAEINALPIITLYDSATWVRVVAVSGTEATGNAIYAIPSEPWLTRASLPLEPFGSPGTLVVRAFGTDGTPFSNFRIELRDPRTGAMVLGAYSRRMAESQEVRNVPAGLWSMTLKSLDNDVGAYALSETIPVEARAGDTRELEWHPRDGGILQIVVDTDGTGAASGELPEINATVIEGPAHVGSQLNVVEDGRQRSRPARTGFPPATVMVVAGVMDPGTYRIRFTAPGFAPAEGTIEVLAADIVRIEARLIADN
jgi:hypothetical protein